MFIQLIPASNAYLQVAGQGILLGTVGYLKVAQMTNFCLTKFANYQNRKYFKPTNLLNFLHQIDSFLKLVDDSNRVFGVILFIFVIINLPLNALLLMMLAKRQILS